MSNLIIILYLFLSLSPVFVLSDEDYNAFIYADCSLLRYNPGSPYESLVDSSLASLINSASLMSYSNFTSPSISLLAQYQCRPDLSASSCSFCLRTAVSQHSALCPSAVGATIQLHACLIQYRNEPFIGKLDTTLQYEKCGAPAASYSGDVLGMRDAVLGTIQASSDIYRIGGAGYVQAESQCIGDLDIQECSECVTVAVSQVVYACAYAGAGEVYLVKCYARYWTNDGYNPSPSSPSSPSSSSSPSSPEDKNKRIRQRRRQRSRQRVVRITLTVTIGGLSTVALITAVISFTRTKPEPVPIFIPVSVLVPDTVPNRDVSEVCKMSNYCCPSTTDAGFQTSHMCGSYCECHCH